jgi:tubulin polyglutamylase TTLL6/13
MSADNKEKPKLLLLNQRQVAKGGAFSSLEILKVLFFIMVEIKNDRCVVQRYMHKPFLIEGLKFDLRIYVLVAGIDPLRIFVFEEGLARFATEPYRPPRTDNLDNRFMHLTNYAVNKENPNFIFNESDEHMDIGHKRSLTSIYKKLS